MLKVLQILVTAHALVGGAAMLSACGQKGPLFSPSTPESAGRATLTQSLSPWRVQSEPATSPAAKNTKSETTAPAAAPSGTPTTAPLNPPAATAATPR